MPEDTKLTQCKETPKNHCQNGRTDICLAGAVDGICCAENECDIDMEFRSITLDSPSLVTS